MKQVRKFKNSDIIDIIKNLEYLRVNLARIGRLEIKNQDDFKKFLQIQNLFIIESNIYRKLTDAWRLLIDNYDGKEEEELDEIIENQNVVWELPFELTTDELYNELKNRYSEYIDFNSKEELD